MRCSVEYAQYTSLAFGKRCDTLDFKPTMGTVGDAYDNAMAESFFASLECELLHRRSFKAKSEARTALFSYVASWPNKQKRPRRRHSGIEYLSPMVFDQKHAAATATSQPNPRITRRPLPVGLTDEPELGSVDNPIDVRIRNNNE